MQSESDKPLNPAEPTSPDSNISILSPMLEHCCVVSSAFLEGWRKGRREAATICEEYAEQHERGRLAYSKLREIARRIREM